MADLASHKSPAPAAGDRHAAWRLPLGWWAAVGAVGLLALLLFALPVARLALAALAPGGAFDPAGLADRLTRPSVVRATLNTLDTAAFGAVAALVIGVPVAVLVALSDLPGRRSLAFLFLLPLMIAPQVMALAFLHLLGPSSALLGAVGLAPPPGSANPLLGRGGIILLYGIQHAPIVFLTLRAGLTRVPRDLLDAARTAGAGPLRALATVVLPAVRPSLIAAAALAFVSGVGNFGIPALLGLPVNYLTLTTLIYQRISSFGPTGLPDAAALSMAIGLIALIGIGVQAVAVGARPIRLATGAPARIALGRAGPAFAVLAWLLIGLILILPAAALLATALVPTFGVPLTPATATLDNFAEVLTRQTATLRAFRNSTLLAGGAALVLALAAVLVAVVAERLPRPAQRLIQAGADLTYALPGIVLAIACILLFLRPLPLIGSLYGTAAIILVAYLMRFMSLALKPVTSAVGQVPRQLAEAAATSGAGPARRLVGITLPLVAPSAAAGALLVFMSAFNELTVSALLWSGGNETLGVVLFSLEEAGLGTQAAAIAVTTVAVTILLLALVDRLGRRLAPGVLPWR